MMRSIQGFVDILERSYYDSALRSKKVEEAVPHAVPPKLCPCCQQPWDGAMYGASGFVWEYLWSGFPHAGCEPELCPDCNEMVKANAIS